MYRAHGGIVQCGEVGGNGRVAAGVINRHYSCESINKRLRSSANSVTCSAQGLRSSGRKGTLRRHAPSAHLPRDSQGPWVSEPSFVPERNP
jgi:hypothetical protein